MFQLFFSNLYIPIIVVTIACPVMAQEAMRSLPGPIPARLVRVVDGDTLAVRAQIWVQQQVDVLVRIRGVDAPELKGQCEQERQWALAAKNRLEQAVDGHPVLFLEQVSADKYGGRVVAKVLLPQEEKPPLDIGAMLLQEGLVHRYDGVRRLRWCPPEGLTGE